MLICNSKRVEESIQDIQAKSEGKKTEVCRLSSAVVSMLSLNSTQILRIQAQAQQAQA